jgi:sialic acid synthase SpsE
VAFVEQAWTLWGAADKGPTASEEENVQLVRKSLHASRDLREGHEIMREDIDILRPETGLRPARLEDVIGTSTSADLRAGDPIVERDLDFPE